MTTRHNATFYHPINQFQTESRHFNVLKGTTRYLCSKCHLMFVWRKDLIRHMNIHLQLRELKCPYFGCHAVFGQRIHLKEHTKRHEKCRIGHCVTVNKKLQYFCDELGCNILKFRSYAILKQHYQTVHSLSPSSSSTQESTTDDDDGTAGGCDDDHGCDEPFSPPLVGPYYTPTTTDVTVVSKIDDTSMESSFLLDDIY